ncbi:MAG TPA: glycerophosphodiester phosphodiesterase [Victivallales bacterium]|nr:glycerophosphodiester phosphodiesterase [Victivallales bacterium]
MSLSILTETHNSSSVIQYNGRPVPGKRVQIYAHRAGRGLLPEQTMPAFKESLRLGVDYVDMDINMTKDGVLVVTHDLGLNPNLTRDADGKWITNPIPIHSMNLKQIQSYNVGKLKPGTEYSKYFPNQKTLEYAKIPTLKKVIQYVKKIAGNEVGFQIEIKNNPTKPELSATPVQYAEVLLKILREENVINRTEVQAFDWRCLIALNKLDPDMKTAYLTDHTAEKLDAKDKEIWTAGLLPKDYDYSFPKMVKYLKGYCWEPYIMDLTRKQLNEAHKLGLKVIVWGWPEKEDTEFNYKKIEQLIYWGVDGFITDRPDILRDILTAKGYNLPQRFSCNS